VDSTSIGADVSVCFGAPLNSLVFHVIPVSIVGVDCVMDVKMKCGFDNPSAVPC
jgi:hypothetical protein